MSKQSILPQSYPIHRQAVDRAIQDFGFAILDDMIQDTNPIADTDAYNTSHPFFKTEEQQKYEVHHIYARTRSTFTHLNSHNVAKVLRRPITKEWIDDFEALCHKMRLIFKRDVWERVVDEFGGIMPIRVLALKDGAYVPKGTPYLQVESTVEGLTFGNTWWEGVFLKNAFAMGAMTRIYDSYKYLKETFEERCAQLELNGAAKEAFWDFYKYRFHSFAFRSFRNEKDAAQFGLAHAVLFHGTDDMWIQQFVPNNELSSISALAHLVVQPFDSELDCMIRTVEVQAQVHKEDPANTGAICAEVIDTNSVDNWIENILPQVQKRAQDLAIHVVGRPDSGDVIQQAIRICRKALDNGWKNISTIVGEGMSLEQAKKYDEILRTNDIPLEMVFYGIGGGWQIDINRDFVGLSMKAAQTGDKPVMKFSATSFKQSIPGKVGLYLNEEGKMVVDYNVPAEKDLYEVIYEFGEGMEAPFWHVYSIEENQANIREAVTFLEQNGVQDEIFKSEAILAKIKEIHDAKVGIE